MSRPLLTVTMCFALGIIFNSMFGVETRTVLVAALAVCTLALACYFLYRHEAVVAMLLLFFFLGWLWAEVNTTTGGDGPEQFAGHYVTLEGIVESEPGSGTGGEDAVYVLAVRALYLGDCRVKTSGLVQVKVKGEGPVYGYGEQLQADGFLYRPREPGNFGAFNYRDYLERRGIRSLMTVNGPEHIRVVESTGRLSLVGLALQYKKELQQVAGATLAQRQAAVLGGMLFGSRDGIDRATKDIFAETGVAHVLCVSGLHVGFVLAGVFLVAGALGLPGRVYLPVAVPVLAFYALMTGMGPAVFRASVMAVMVLAAAMLERERDWPTALALAAGLLLLINPLYIHELGFQLSLAATWGILYLGPILGEPLAKRLALPRWLAVPLQVTLAAQLATMPLLIYHFNLVSFIAPLANLLLVPLVGAIMLAGFLGCVTGLVFLPAGELINAGTGALIDFFMVLAGCLNAIPGGAAYVATPPWPAVLLWYAGLVLTAEGVRGRVVLPAAGKPGKAGPAAAGILLMLVLIWPWAGTGGRMQVHFLDVGQGDSILVRFPGGKTMLVDTGGRPGEPREIRATGDTVVVPYLRHLGINRLDALVVTHPHEDHAGGVPAVLEKLKVGALIITDFQGYDEIIALAETFRVPVYRVGTGQALQLDEQVDVLVLAPGRGDDLAGIEPNDASLVLRLDYRDSSFLLTGDIEKQAQQELLAGGAQLQSDVFKVPHHGSRFYDPRFYKEVAPELAVIQVGANNRFGHPAADTIEALESFNARVLRTDRDGAVLITTDGRKINVQTVKKAMEQN